MDVIEKDIANRRTEIAASMRDLFKINMKITDWDVPEANHHEAAELIVAIFQEVLDEIKEDVKAGRYDNY